MPDTYHDSLTFTKDSPYHYFVLKRPDGSTETVRANSLHLAFKMSQARVTNDPRLSLVKVGRVG